MFSLLYMFWHLQLEGKLDQCLDCSSVYYIEGKEVRKCTDSALYFNNLVKETKRMKRKANLDRHLGKKLMGQGKWGCDTIDDPVVIILEED